METTSYPSSVDNFEDTLRTSDSYVQDMLNFYHEGWSARGEDDLIKIEKRVKANIVTTLTYTFELFQKFHLLQIVPKSAFIKLENPTSILVLFAVSNEDFVNRKLLEVYHASHRIEKAVKSDSFRVSFSITYDNDGSLDSECLKSDGFFRIELPAREPLLEESTRRA